MTVTGGLRRFVRDVVRSAQSGGLPFFFSIAMTALGLFAVGVFFELTLHFNKLATRVGETVASVAFLSVDDALAAEEIRARLAAHPAIKEARLVSPEAALARARKGLGENDRALMDAEGLKMPWVVEIVPRLGMGTERERVFEQLGKDAGVDEVVHPSAEARRVDALLGLIEGAGAFLGFLVALVVVVVISNAVKLTVFARRDEIAIQKLVGATDAYVRAPLLASGALQGLIGAVLAVIALGVARTSLAGLTRVALSGAFGPFVLESPPAWVAPTILFAGAALGLLGALLSSRRFLKT